MYLQAFVNPEDTASFKGLKPKFDDPDVERVRLLKFPTFVLFEPVQNVLRYAVRTGMTWRTS